MHRRDVPIQAIRRNTEAGQYLKTPIVVRRARRVAAASR
jgi:hypothetical protein